MRTTLDYIQTKQLDNAAASSPGGSVEPVTGLRISTGTNSGDFIELTDAQAAQVSTQGLNAFIITAGSGQTNGNYTVAASYGPAILNYTVAGNVVTAISVTGDNGQYGPAVQAANANTPPTFTLAANGGTAGTVQASFATLRSGIYQRVKLSSSIPSVIVGQSLYWNRTDTTDPYAVTNVSAASTANGADFAGVVIDPFAGTTPSGGTQLTYMWMQATGDMTGLMAAAATVGSTVSLPTSSANQFLALATNPTYVGTVIVAGTNAAGPAVFRNTLAQSRY
jgi:hypothetical protein